MESVARCIDALVLHPSTMKRVYQSLGRSISAVETPVWCGMLAQYLRSQSFIVDLLDCEANSWNENALILKLKEETPRLLIVVVYGQQPSASTQNMHGAIEICHLVKKYLPEQKILIIGGHIAALPERSLEDTTADFAALGEGFSTSVKLLENLSLSSEQLIERVPSLLLKKNDQFYRSIKKEGLLDLQSIKAPYIAYDLMPMKKYRAHNWHCFDGIENRNSYASIYTSLGCPFRCSFCCINAPFGGSSFRYWKPEVIIEQIDILVKDYQVKNLKISDEMFVLNEKHFLRLCELLIERNYNLNIWAYARIDTIKPYHLDKLKKAGVNWLVLGIESKSQYVRQGVAKDRFCEEDIVKVVELVRKHGIYVHANYIFGLPDDDFESMEETLTLALKLNTEMANFYSAMAYPGSSLYNKAVENGWKLPSEWIGYSQHSKETYPLQTKHLRSEEILGFRDYAWNKYFTNPNYLQMIEKTFGKETRKHIESLSEYCLERSYKRDYHPNYCSRKAKS